jgi:hypothetical protein
VTSRDYYNDYAAHRVNTLVWNAPVSDEITYTVDPTSLAVVLNTTRYSQFATWAIHNMHAHALALPVLRRVSTGSHVLNCSLHWPFRTPSGYVKVPVFTAPGQFNTTFTRLFRAVFTRVVGFVADQGWLEIVRWASITDEPTWEDPVSAANIIALGRLYKSLHPSIGIFQTRFPVPLGTVSAPIPSPFLSANSLLARYHKNAVYLSSRTQNSLTTLCSNKSYPNFSLSTLRLLKLWHSSTGGVSTCHSMSRPVCPKPLPTSPRLVASSPPSTTTASRSSNSQQRASALRPGACGSLSPG